MRRRKEREDLPPPPPPRAEEGVRRGRPRDFDGVVVGVDEGKEKGG